MLRPMGGDTGNRYSDSDAGMYTSNCPWNDWTPPSHSRRLFEAANKANAEAAASGVRARVRVNVCRSADSRTRGEKMLIAFASVEVDEQGAKALVLRRGSEVVACLPMHAISVHQEHKRERILHVFAVSSPAESMCLYVENVRRLDTLLALFK